ncbi:MULTISPECIES: patatin-like phospholipase family protein [unclassified Shinella]|uniref:patatin-like phospholipase family protein n=1 Tax=unclassified Shinella TaxID=2643062 RepID=UPI0006820827|nr:MULTISPECIES: patatin-like phospholipase family protein [unclassified Shinella]
MRECDLVMKGGITSGVVYPHAIVEIARAYRLRSIGGTSAGAIAAAVAAAAEYRRERSAGKNDFTGYDGIVAIADEIGRDMASLFQPAPKLKPLFDILMAASAAGIAGKPMAVMKAMLAAYRGRALTAAVLGLAVVVVGICRSDVSLAVLGIVAGIVLLVTAMGLALWRAVKADLPAHDFGICPGLTQKGNGKPALTDWLADRIDRVAGNLDPDGIAGDPLTIGQLADHGIEVATMTTDLSSGRPYQLPLKSDHHYFSRREFEALFPKRVVDYLVRGRAPLADVGPQLPADLYPLASGRDFPVLLVARMSLSFPGLISAVPLYRFDDLLPEGPGRSKVRRCLFSDGGISSNFPIHFFDSFLPSRPTFGITLSPWEEARHGDVRVELPSHPRQSTHLPVRTITGIGNALSSILNTAKDWQDTLQSLLPGYADRIVEIRLDESREGGMNLAMDESTIRQLGDYGRQAGRALVERFDFDEHRWLRAVSLMPKLEGALDGMATAYRAPPAGGGPIYETLLTDHTPRAYRNTQKWREEVLVPFVTALAGIGEKAADAQAADGAGSVRKGAVPSADSNLRLVAGADRAPVRKTSSSN